MPAAAKYGCLCTGHGGFPPRVNDQASEDVFINSIGSHRVTDHWVVHCSGNSCHDSTLAEGSSTVFVNGLAMARIGDGVACGSVIAEGSENVFCGG